MKNNCMVIDAHCHLFPEKIVKKATAGLSDFYNLPVFHQGTAEDLIREGERAGIDRFVAAGVATSPEQVLPINRFLKETANNSGGKIAVLGALHPDSADLDSEIGFLMSSGFSGAKLHADFQKIAIDDSRCFRIYERVAGRLPLLVHTGDCRYGYSNPENLLPVLKAFPSLTVVGAHFGGWSVWEDAAEKLAEFDNFTVDTSSSFPFLDDKDIFGLLSAYGADRVLFGTDYPMWDMQKELERLLALNLPQAVLEKILNQNAKRVYGF